MTSVNRSASEDLEHAVGISDIRKRFPSGTDGAPWYLASGRKRRIPIAIQTRVRAAISEGEEADCRHCRRHGNRSATAGLRDAEPAERHRSRS